VAADPTELLKRAERRRADRATFESHWQEIRDYLLPIAKAFTGSETAGSKNRSQILDNSGETASDYLVSALNGLLTNPGTKWFSLRTANRRLIHRLPVPAWLQQAEEIIYQVLESKAVDFYTRLPRTYHELADFGTAAVYIADRPGKLPLFQERPLEELTLGESAEGRIDQVDRWFEMTARQAVQWWPDAPAELKKLAADKPDQVEKFLTCFYPREGADTRYRDRAHKAFAACDLWLGKKLVLAENGYDELPIIAGRWDVRSGEVYGRGPGAKALADVKMLQRAMQVSIRAGEKMVDPALMVADDGVLAPVRTGLGAINHVRADLLQQRHAPIGAIKTEGRPDLAEEFMLGIRARIETAYYVHMLKMSRDPRMTATQVIAIDEEQMRTIGPFLARVQSELLGPVIDRFFTILLRAGAFPPAPPDLRGQEITVEYVSPIARAQRLSEVAATERLIQVNLPLIQMRPELLDNIDLDAKVRLDAERLGVPLTLMRDEAAIKQIREQRQAAIDAEEEKSDLERGAAAAQSLAQASQAQAANDVSEAA